MHLEKFIEVHRRTTNAVADLSTNGSDFIFATRYTSDSLLNTQEYLIAFTQSVNSMLADYKIKIDKLESEVNELTQYVNKA